MQAQTITKRSRGFGFRLRWYVRYKYAFLLLLPGILFYIIFHYVPMYGVIIAFKDYGPYLGIMKSPWVGLRHFRNFFSDPYFLRTLRNTLVLSFYSLIFAFPAPIILSLMLNELKSDRFKKTVQMITYLPHFISQVIIVGLVVSFLSPTKGILNIALQKIFGMTPVPFMIKPNYFRLIYIASGIWQDVGFGTIIFLASISSIDPTLYEVVDIDGGGRWAKMWYVTLPAMIPVITLLLIFRVAAILNTEVGKIVLMYNPLTFETADTVGTYVFRRGLQGAEYSYGTAVGLFNAVIGLLLLVIANTASRRFTETSLW